LLELLRNKGIPRYLETNGTLPDRLEGVAELVDCISMDLKLDSAGGTGDRLAQHQEFLRRAAGRPLFLKTVITASTDENEAVRAFAALAAVDRRITLILQPATGVAEVQPPGSERMVRFFALASEHFEDVRIIPQLHRVMGLA
jgi:organic radical activating enzyme